METLLQQKGFTKILFDAIPQLALLLDPECRVHALNQSAKDVCGYHGELEYERCGEVIGYAHWREHPQGCGFGPSCPNCIIRTTAIEALKGTESR